MDLKKISRIINTQFENLKTEIICDLNNVNTLCVTRSSFDIPFRCGGPLKSARLILSQSCEWRFEVLSFVLEADKLTTNLSENFLDRLLQLKNSDYDMCWGISKEDLEKPISLERFLTVVEQKTPFPCFRSSTCSRWFNISSRSMKNKNICVQCSILRNRLMKALKCAKVASEKVISFIKINLANTLI